jgi:hypothetical protein
LLHSSKSKAELLAMCKNIYKNLKKDGRFVGLVFIPKYLKYEEKKVGSTAICVNKKRFRLKDGDKFKITLYNKRGEKTCSFYNYYWSKRIYRTIFQKVGFKKNKMVQTTCFKRWNQKIW